MNLTTDIKSAIDTLLDSMPRVVVAIDGRCASGKTTLAAELAAEYQAGLIHADDFFLPPELRSPERYAQPGGNMHYERLECEVLRVLADGGEVRYRPFDCSRMEYGEQITIAPKPLTVIEGAYCLMPDLSRKATPDSHFYDLTVFMDISPGEQLKRIARRNGEHALKAFKERWIPLEESYFKAYDVKNKCALIVCAD